MLGPKLEFDRQEPLLRPHQWTWVPELLPWTFQGRTLGSFSSTAPSHPDALQSWQHLSDLSRASP